MLEFLFLVRYFSNGIFCVADGALHPAFGLFSLTLGFCRFVSGRSANAFFDRTGNFFDATGDSVFVHFPNSLFNSHARKQAGAIRSSEKPALPGSVPRAVIAPGSAAFRPPRERRAADLICAAER
jgi:hypothetical protein